MRDDKLPPSAELKALLSISGISPRELAQRAGVPIGELDRALRGSVALTIDEARLCRDVLKAEIRNAPEPDQAAR